jgi:AraC-like DNA-binding protein
MLREETIETPSGLRPWVAGIDHATMLSPQPVIDLPDHAISLVLRTAPGEPAELVVQGPRTRARYYQGEPGPACFRVRVRPGRARSLLGRSVRDLADEVVPLSDFWGAELAGDLLFEPAGIADRLAAALLGRASGEFQHSDLIDSAATLVSTGVAASARQLHVSERHLRNLFVEAVGMPPKRFARIDRVRTVLAHAHDRPWSELATEAGYYDHSHMTAEFRAIMGVPPSAFLRGELPMTAACDRTS